LPCYPLRGGGVQAKGSLRQVEDFNSVQLTWLKMKNKIKDFYYSNATRSEAELSKGGSEARLSKSHSHLQASPRKTFKKLYEQKHLVRNTKDQYSAVCDKVWQKSHQRLKIQLDGAMSNSIPLTECSTQSEGTKSKTAFGKSTTFDFFDLYPVKKTPSSNNRYMLLGSASMLPLGSAAAPVPPKSKTTFGKGGSASLTSSIVVK
jgi:hypothetical protein